MFFYSTVPSDFQEEAKASRVEACSSWISLSFLYNWSPKCILLLYSWSIHVIIYCIRLASSSEVSNFLFFIRISFLLVLILSGLDLSAYFSLTLSRSLFIPLALYFFLSLSFFSLFSVCLSFPHSVSAPNFKLLLF